MIQNRNAAMIRRIESTPVRYPFSFTFLGDCGVAPNRFQEAVFGELLNQMEQLDPKPLFFATLGDFAGPGDRAGHERYLRLAERLTMPNVCLLGNHELDAPEGADMFRQICALSS